MLPINKIYIDSRHKTISSKSDSDFEIQLKEAINLPDNCVCVVSDVVLKNTLTTIEPFNQNIYVRVDNVDKIVKLDSRNYNIKDLGAHITAKLNEQFRTEEVNKPFEFVEDVFNTKILIAPVGRKTLRIFTDDELKINNITWNGGYYDKFNLKSINSVISNYGTSITRTASNPFITGRVSLQSLDYVLLSSFSLGYTSYGSREGERHIIKKIGLMPYGEISSMPFFDVSDCIPVHKMSLTRLKFIVTDPYGNIIDLHGGNISFSLLFISND